MSENTNSFVKYLNGLHNYNAQNPNAYGEKNVESPFYSKTMVNINVCQHIINSLMASKPHILVLTGHAGDGKTSLMYQVIKNIGLEPDLTKQINEIILPSGNTCCCIKDFSELSDEEKFDMMKKVVEYPSQGKYVFMVANTGPLINTFGRLFDEPSDCEKAKMQLIEAMDSNKGEIFDIYDYPFLVINVAAIDNTTFPVKYLGKIISEELWCDCSNCDKRAYCHILKNKTLIRDNIDHVSDFLSKYYIWETEYGNRLTIRSMTEQLAYMITGGLDCEDVSPADIHKLLFFNLFFGYIGTLNNPQSQNLLAVKLAQDNKFEFKRMRADEDLIIRRDFASLFSEDVQKIIAQAERNSQNLDGWTEELRRIYFFLNIVTEETWRRDTEDIFSKQYISYLDVRCGKTKSSKAQKQLVIDAFRTIYLGTVISNSNTIPITLSKESGVAQSVQLVVGELSTSDIELVARDSSLMNPDKKDIILRIHKQDTIALTLPVIDYFEELRNGVISTNIDPQLSHGIESLKAQLLKVAHSDSDDLEIIVLNNSGYEKNSITIEDCVLRLI